MKFLSYCLFSLFLCHVNVALAAKAELPQKSVKKTEISGRVDLNKADAQTIAKSLKGIGLKRAEAIVRYRTKNGHFKSMLDLAKVKGISVRFIEKNKEYLNKKVLLQ